MPAAAIPLITAGVGAVGSIFGAKKASTPSPTETAATGSETTAANALTSGGTSLQNYGLPKLQQAGQYYSTLAGGNRAATAQAVAPDVANTNSVYGGTQQTLSRFLKGPSRDQALSDLSRERAGAISSIYTGARAQGVQGLASLGQYGVQAGTQALGGAAGINQGIAGMGQSNRFAGAAFSSEAGSSTANLLFQLLKSGQFNFGKGSGNASTGFPTPAVTDPGGYGAG